MAASRVSQPKLHAHGTAPPVAGVPRANNCEFAAGQIRLVSVDARYEHEFYRGVPESTIVGEAVAAYLDDEPR